jgi:large repetitive protein
MRSSIQNSRESQFRVSTRPRPGSARKMHRRRTTLECLEQRTLMAVLPPVTHNPQIPNPVNISGGSGNKNMSAPKIAVDPANPQKLVATWVDLDPTDFGPNISSLIEAAYSTNGGASWQSLGVGGNINDPTTSAPVLPYRFAIEPSVAFDHQNHVYLLSHQENAGNASGAFLLNVYDFTGSSPTVSVSRKVVNQWESNPPTSPVLAVDSGVDQFTDPASGLVQSNPFAGSVNNPQGANVSNAGNVYVAWATNDGYLPSTTTPASYNPNRIQIVASTNAGQSFGPVQYVDNTGFTPGNPRYATPALTVSQGRAPGTFGPNDRGVPAGQVTVGFDNFNTGANATPPVDILLANRIQAGESLGFNGATGTIIDALLNTVTNVTTPVTTPFPVNVQLDSRFTTLTDASVTLNLIHPALSDLLIQLQAPNGGPLITLMAVATPGSNLGIDGNGNAIGTTFDSSGQVTLLAASAAGTAASPFLGTFQPVNSLKAALAGLTPAQLNGQWTLLITDNVNSGTPPPPQRVVNWTLHLTSGMTNAANTVINSQNTVRLQAPTVSAATPQGIAPGLVLASDNTLGSYSTNEGRLYAVYVDRYDPILFPAFAANNPLDNTDIFLKVSDDGGVTWKTVHTVGGIQDPVNDDSGPHDGFSEGTQLTDLNQFGGTIRNMAGRPQFQPQVAVDQQTGTLVISYLDTRWDPARARVATTIATSLTGGATFGPETFANQANTALDVITRKTVVLGPIPENQSSLNTKTDATYGFGGSQGLAVLAGHIYPAWSGNQNGGLLDANRTNTLTIQTAPMVTAAGPRIIGSTMGPVKPTTMGGVTFNNQPAGDGTDQVDSFVVIFDRPIDVNSFDKTSVLVQYLSPTADPTKAVNTPGGPVSVAVGSVQPLDQFGPQGLPTIEATTFRVIFTQPQSAVGTYSYEIVASKIRDAVRTNPSTQAIIPGATVTNAAAGAQINLPIPTSGTGGTGTAQDTTTSTINVSNVAVNDVVNTITVTVQLNHTFDSDMVITLIAPDGTPVILSNHRGGGGQNFNTTTFTDAAGIPIRFGAAPFNGPFRPDQALNNTLRGRTAFGNWTLQIQDTQAGNSGTLLNWSMTIQTGSLPSTPGLQTGNLMDQNANGTPGESGDFYATPMPLNGGSAFNAPYDNATVPIIIAGPHFIDTVAVLGNGTQAPLPVGQADNPDNLVTDNTVSGLDVTFDRDMNAATFTAAKVLQIMGPAGLVPLTNVKVVISPVNGSPAHARTFRITFPTQQLSGTYTLTLDSSIQSAAGNSLDTNLNAGLDVLHGSSPTGSNVPIISSSTDTPLPIPPQKTLTSNITVNSSFPIQGVTLTLNITSPNDTDLEASLIALDPGGDPTKDIVIPLFTRVGSAGGQQGFNNTIFDDNAATPIQNGGRPFFGTFKPQQSLVTALLNVNSARTFQLQIKNNSTINTSTLNSWSLTLLRNVAGTGLGEPVADRAQLSFRIFTMNPTNPLSSNTWTAVGPAAIGGGGGAGPESSIGSRSGRIGGLAVDPSDPSGNTVFIGGASGGVWKTTNFLTTDPQGPTYIPLTDFGPTFGINIGSIAVFGRNNDTNQSIVIAATGEGDTISPGVGFLLSTNGGTSWTLLDSLTNVDGSGNPLAITSPLRDHTFVGTTAFKVVVDPSATKTGEVIMYAGIADPTGNNKGGIYRSIDTGKHWKQVLAGDATDIVLDPASGVFNAFSNPTSNLQIAYAAIRGVGVFQTQNEGQGWIQLLGNVGDPFFQDISKTPATPVPITGSTAAPSGGGRIVLAKPELTASKAQNSLYQGWLYAAVVTPAALGNPRGSLQGLYMTKDFGRNWTLISLPNQVNGATAGIQANPSNDISLPTTVDPLGNPAFGSQGNYDVSLIADPNNPNVVYLGGTADGNATGLIRVDTTGISDPYSFYLGENTTTGAVRADTTDPIGLSKPLASPTNQLQFPPRTVIDPRITPAINMVHDPFNPFSNSTFYTDNATAFANSGADVRWIPFDTAVFGSTDQHRVFAMKDPLTGQSRLIWGDDQGVYTDVITSDGKLVAGLGTLDDSGNPNIFVTIGSRSGNLQITQFYYGAAQASNIAAQVAALQGMFYGNAQDDGFPHSLPNVIQPGLPGYGNINWSGPGGDGGGVATDQNNTPGQNPGDVFQYAWPCCLGNGTDFFQVNGIGQTLGLVRNINPPGSQVPDPQWPFTGVVNFAVNPLDADQIVISSFEGRLYRTETRGSFWLPFAEPGVDILDGSQSLAIAFGAPEPDAVGGSSSLDNFVYTGTKGGHIYVTTNGGGTGNWTDISAGLDGSSVEKIVTNPTRGSNEAYAVTANGVYHMVDSSAANATWVQINGPTDLAGNPLVGNIFGNTHNTFGDPSLNETTAKPFTLAAIQADWRYLIPDNLSKPNGPTHPLLYVGGQAGVYRSLDGGQTWSAFPDSGTGSLLNSPYPDSGGLPIAQVTDLTLSLGFINPTTGQPDESTGSNVLLATTYGRGSFAIRLAPIVFPNSLVLDPKLPAPTGSAGLGGVISVLRPVIDGLSEQSAFGNTVTINLIDETPTDATFGQIIGTGTTDASGRFAVRVNQGVFKIDGSTDGPKIIGVQAINASGTKGNIATINFTLKTATLGISIALLPSDDSGTKGDNVTNVTQPHLFGTAPPGLFPFVDLIDTNGDVSGTIGKVLATVVPDSGGHYLIQFPSALADKVYHIQTQARDLDGNTVRSPVLTLTIDTHAPATAPTLSLLPADDTGIKGDGVTVVRRPHIVGTSEPGSIVNIVQDQFIPDNGSLISSITTPFDGGQFVIANLGVQLDITHPRDSDLTVILIDPKGALHTLFSGVGGTGKNFTNTILDDQAATPITGSSAPFTGSFQTPGKVLLSLAGLPLQGLWRLQITDNKPGPGGPATLNSWALVATPKSGGAAQTFRPSTPILASATADASGNYILQLANNLNNGSIALQAQATDRAGNIGPLSAPFVLTITAVSGDYDGDGKADLPVFTSSTAQWSVLESTNGSTTLPVTGTPNSLPLLGDFNGDGKTDQITFNSATAVWTIRSSSGLQTIQFGLPGDIPVPGAYDGNSRTELAVYEPKTFTWRVLSSTLGKEVDTVFGQAGDTPAPAGYDSNQTTEIAVYRSSTAQFLILTPTGTRTVKLGTPTTSKTPIDVPVSSDYEGAGRAQPAVFEPTTGTGTATWRIMSSLTGKEVDTKFGQAGDTPVPLDYEGNGKTDFAVFRKTSPVASWIIMSSATGQTRTQKFGAPTDTPVPEPLLYLLGTLKGTAPAVKSASIPTPKPPVTTKAASIGTTAPVAITSSSAVHTTPAASSVTLRRQAVKVTAHTTGVGSVNQHDVALTAALLGLGRLKAGRFLPHLGA